MTTRTHVTMPKELVAEIDALVGKRSRSQFLIQVATKELIRQRQIAAIHQATGAWKAEAHPELRGGAVAYVKKLRQESEGRFKKQLGRR